MASNPQPSLREPATRPAPRPPLDLTHHFSEATKRRTPSKIKQYYKYFLIPGIGNLAGGLPNAQFFPFDTLEAQTAQPERWKPTPNHPEPDWEADIDNDVPSAPTSGPDAGVPSPPDAPRPEKEGLHMTVPMVSGERDITRKVDVTTALQYGTAQGYPALLSFVRQFTREHLHPNVPYAGGPEVILTCGSTDGFAKSIELLLDTWLPDYQPESQREGLLCEKFVYPNVLSQTAPKGVQPVPVEVDAEGMVASGPGGLEHVLAHWDSRKGKRPRIMYTVTMGHNPTSGVLSVARRKELYDICERYDVIIIEDDPYWYLQYPSSTVEEAKSRNLAIPEPVEPEPLEKSSGFPFLDSLIPSYLSIDTSGRVIRLDTFSKTVAPGCRLGWITAQPLFIDRLLRITESTTQQPSGFVQSMVANLVLGPQPPSAMHAFNSLAPEAQTSFAGWDMSGWVRWLAGLRGAYERRMNRMCNILDAGAIQLRQSTPSSPQDSDYGIISTTRLMSFPWPRGGMFLWLRVYFESHPLFGAPRPLLAKPCLSSTGGGWHPRTSTATAAGPGCPSTPSANGPSGAPLHASQHFQVQRHRVVDGPALANALMLYLTRKPHLVLVSPGLMFSATDAVRAADGWRFLRLCFAAESEENVDACSHRFVAGLHKFWKIKKVEELEEILREVETREVTALLETLRIGGTLPGAANPGALGNLAWIGC